MRRQLAHWQIAEGFGQWCTSLALDEPLGDRGMKSGQAILQLA